MKRHVTYANVASTLALVLAMTGVGYAAVVLPPSSVGTRQLKAGAVTGAKVKDGSLGAKDFRTADLSGLRGPAGPGGAPGATGQPGPKGADGAPGSARAYAMVAPGATPSFVATKTKNFSAIVGPSTTGLVGYYCLTPAAGIDASTLAAVASPEYAGTSTRGAETVEVHRGGSGTCTDNKVIVVTYSSGVASNGVAFSVLLP